MKWQTDPCVLKTDSGWLLYFGCNNEGGGAQIGFATSDDGIIYVYFSGLKYKTDPPLFELLIGCGIFYE